MTKEAIINQTLQIINKLPQNKVEEVFDFATFVLKRYNEKLLIEGIQSIVSESDAFSFLKDEEDIYTLDDLKERFND